MNTIQEIKQLIKEAKEGKSNFPSLDKSEIFIKKVSDYSDGNIYKSESHNGIALMMLLDEINRLQRQIDLLQ